MFYKFQWNLKNKNLKYFNNFIKTFGILNYIFILPFILYYFIFSFNYSLLIMLIVFPICLFTPFHPAPPPSGNPHTIVHVHGSCPWVHNKMAIYIHKQLNLKNKANKKNRDRIMDMESILMVARWEGIEGEWVKMWGG